MERTTNKFGLPHVKTWAAYVAARANDPTQAWGYAYNASPSIDHTWRALDADACEASYAAASTAATSPAAGAGEEG